MFDLILAIASSMLVSVTMRVSERHAKNNISMLAVNYMMCTAMAAAFTGTADFFPAAQGMPFALGLGALSGVFYLGSFMLLQWNIRTNGVVMSSLFMKLGVMVPTLMAILVFGEVPCAAQAAGMAAALLAILLINLEKGAGRVVSGVGLVAVLLAGGLTDSFSKVYEELGAPALENHYLLYTFAAALVLCAALALAKGQRLTKKDALFGLLIGAPNYFSARFLLRALTSVPAVIVYPTYSVGTIVAVSLVGVLAFGEKLSRRQMLCMGLILAALVLLNV